MNIFKKTSPTSLWIVGGLVVLVGICWYLGGWSRLMTYWSQRQYLNKIENLKEAYRQDTYGAATPEGTLKLFIDAFQKGDVELASKYFVVEKQEEYRDKIGSWIKLNKRDELVLLFKRASWNDASGGDKDEMDVWESGEILTSIFFSKNTYSGLWKIEQL